MSGLVAFDLVLGIVFGGMMHMAFVVKISGVDGDDGPRHPACLGIPAYVIADLESPSHLVDSLFLTAAVLSMRSRTLPLVTVHLFATAPPFSRYRGQADLQQNLRKPENPSAEPASTPPASRTV